MFAEKIEQAKDRLNLLATVLNAMKLLLLGTLVDSKEEISMRIDCLFEERLHILQIEFAPGYTLESDEVNLVVDLLLKYADQHIRLDHGYYFKDEDDSLFAFVYTASSFKEDDNE